MALRMLAAGDEPALESFLRERSDGSMFLRGNASASGIVDRGEPRHGTWVADWDGASIRAVAAHFRNGMLALQAPQGAKELAAEAVRRSGRRVAGLSGPWEQVTQARAALGLASAPTRLDSREDLFGMALADLRVPEPPPGTSWSCERPRGDEVPLLVRWRIDYGTEALGEPAGPEAAERARRNMDDLYARGAAWILRVDGQATALCAYLAMLPDAVQIGSVFTPPALRGRGYARAVVAGALRIAHQDGVRRAIVYSGKTNAAARRAYEAIGFRIVGEYGLVLLA